LPNIQVGVIGPGSMGSAIGRKLAGAGASVLTVLAGRSPQSARRARESGMQDAGLEALAACDFILSIVPPGVAAAVAEQLAPALASSSRKGLYIDCNAISPNSAQAIARIVEASGASFADGGIIGLPSAPRIYVSGPSAGRALELNALGLQVKELAGEVGAASSLKMAYAGITKGLTAIGAVMSLAAVRHDVGPALRDELADSQPELLAWLSASVPRMPPKAYRWVAEMREIEHFIGDGFPEHAIYGAISELYARLAQENAETKTLQGFFDLPATPADATRP
jgi:3-hydroxyisobutyrate dehydrogenase-like beta-hydroxyacid dehydrogenase